MELILYIWQILCYEENEKHKIKHCVGFVQKSNSKIDTLNTLIYGNITSLSWVGTGASLNDKRWGLTSFMDLNPYT
jgi:hypothetical protein